MFIAPSQIRKTKIKIAQRMPAERCHLRTPVGGNSGGPPLRLSRYSQMTIESNMTRPSSSTSVAILPSGLVRIKSRFGFFIATTLRTRSICFSMPFSFAQIITLRTKGERGGQCSFTTAPSRSSPRDPRRGRAGCLQGDSQRWPAMGHKDFRRSHRCRRRHRPSGTQVHAR